MTFDRAVVVIPAHDEARELDRCLRAVVSAAACAPIPVLTVVVLDTCSDRSAALAGNYGDDVHFVEIQAENVGTSRAAGFGYAHDVCEFDVGREAHTWYATSDADSRVDADWLVRQLDADADMVLGVVRVTDWHDLPARSVRRYLAAYRSKVWKAGSGHDHVHGANMGFRADAYWGVGGFAPLTTGEDVDLVRRFQEAGRRIHRDVQLSVVTSARSEGRAPQGFAGHLKSVSEGGGAL